MTFRLTIRCENSAFADDDSGPEDQRRPAPEIARILRELAHSLEGDDDIEAGSHGQLRDANGNTVGSWAVIG